jgi:phosphate transport system substrate-binding protein
VTDSGSKRLVALAFASVIAIGACSSTGASATPSAAAPSTAASAPATSSEPPPADLTGSVTIDGSSTVYPITEAIAEDFQNANGGVKVTAAFSGTGGGFKLFCVGDTDINDASRPI